MSHRQYPRTDRSLRQVSRHTQPAAPFAPGGIVVGPTFAEAMSNLASWGDRWRPWHEALDAAYLSQPTTWRHRIGSAVASAATEVLDGIDAFALRS